MPTFDVTIEHRVIAYLIVQVNADTAAEAATKVHGVIDACHGDPDTIAAHYGTNYPEFWEVEEEDITVASVAQLNRV